MLQESDGLEGGVWAAMGADGCTLLLTTDYCRHPSWPWPWLPEVSCRRPAGDILPHAHPRLHTDAGECRQADFIQFVCLSLNCIELTELTVEFIVIGPIPIRTNDHGVRRRRIVDPTARTR